ncbi:ATP-binding protein [Couchioplanes azureus]|uniref:ATP-binding protein n=1 Tax=Couchioplanes caeruleus TaxID=56438 RepID=UPI0016704F52|nr:ATP-binding protein [Couchioplanes caeruleus]GGQ84704.1 hypothetical protein GCM10010166_63640 [Couchioplanes caeruleus subsp. azureus]
MTDGARSVEGEPDTSEAAAAPPTVLLHQYFTKAQVSLLRSAVSAAVAGAGLSGVLCDDFVLAVHELVTNAVRHGGGTGHLALWQQADVLTCEIVDYGGQAGALPVRLAPPDQTGGRGLWMAHHLTGTLVLTQRLDGVTAAVSVRVTASPATSTAVHRLF